MTWFITVGAQKPDVEQSGSVDVSYSPSRTEALLKKIQLANYIVISDAIFKLYF